MRHYTKVHCLSYFPKCPANVVLFLETNSTVTQKQVESRLEMSFGVFGAAKLHSTISRTTNNCTDGPPLRRESGLHRIESDR